MTPPSQKTAPQGLKPSCTLVQTGKLSRCPGENNSNAVRNPGRAAKLSAHQRSVKGRTQSGPTPEKKNKKKKLALLVSSLKGEGLREFEIKILKKLTLIFLCALVASCSATSLRCGTDGESSYVDLVNLPQDISANSRYYAALCSFAYEAQNETT